MTKDKALHAWFSQFLPAYPTSNVPDDAVFPWLTYANIMYIMRKQLTPEKIEEVFHKLNLIFEFTDFSPMILEKSAVRKFVSTITQNKPAISENPH